MKGLKISTACIALATVAQANFSGSFDVGNWLATNGGVDTSLAPASIQITSNDDGSNLQVDRDFQITVLSDVIISFDWSYTTADDDASFDPFYFLIDGSETEVTDPSLTAQSGFVSGVSVLAGETFAFRMRSIDSTFGSGVVTVSDFQAIPEPGTISLMSLSTVSLFLTRTIRRRKRAGQTLLPVRRERVCDTFCTEEEFYAVHAVSEESDLVAEWVAASAERLGIAWNRLSGAYSEFDKAFWNRMVARHERVVARRKAFRLAFKKKAVDGFDAFLATILK